MPRFIDKLFRKDEDKTVFTSDGNDEGDKVNNIEFKKTLLTWFQAIAEVSGSAGDHLGVLTLYEPKETEPTVE